MSIERCPESSPAPTVPEPPACRSLPAVGASEPSALGVADAKPKKKGKKRPHLATTADHPNKAPVNAAEAPPSPSRRDLSRGTGHARAVELAPVASRGGPADGAPWTALATGGDARDMTGRELAAMLFVVGPDRPRVRIVGMARVSRALDRRGARPVPNAGRAASRPSFRSVSAPVGAAPGRPRPRAGSDRGGRCVDSSAVFAYLTPMKRFPNRRTRRSRP